MTRERADALEIAANFCKFDASRKIYVENKKRYMEIFGHRFWYNPDTDLYEIDDAEDAE